jgi:hypothetical protein
MLEVRINDRKRTQATQRAGHFRSACLRSTAITATQKDHTRRRDIGMSRYVARHSNTESNACDQAYEFNFALLSFFCGNPFEKAVSVPCI